MIHVALDTNGLHTGQGGVARYIHRLRHELQQFSCASFRVSDLAWPVANVAYTQPMRAMKTAYRELVWARFAAPRLLSGEGANLVHITSNVPFRLPASLRRVVTLYDLAPLRHPERFRRWHRLSWRHFAATLGSADKIICISRFTADEAMALLNLPSSLLEVIYCGVEEPPESNPAELPELPEEFLLFVGCLEPGKNLDLLRAVYARAESQNHPLPVLVVVGPKREGVAHGNLHTKGWIHLGVQTETVLNELYHAAMALLFPSRYEGFGLPVAEAMSFGCPVICSPVASLPEVAGKAALFAEQDAPSYLEAIRSLLVSPSLRSELSTKGRVQARRFSWKTCAERTLEVYQDVMR